MKKIIKSVFKSLYWNIFGIFFGLSQLGILLLLKSLNVVSFDYDKIFKDGVILFFCSTFVFASITEYYFTKKHYIKLFEAFFFYMLPMILIIFIVVLYCGSAIGFDKVDINLLKNGTYVCLTISILHSIIFQTLKFYSKGSR